MKKPVVIGLAVVVLAAVVGGGDWWDPNRQDNGLTLYGNGDIRTGNLCFRGGGGGEWLGGGGGGGCQRGAGAGGKGAKPV